MTCAGQSGLRAESTSLQKYRRRAGAQEGSKMAILLYNKNLPGRERRGRKANWPGEKGRGGCRGKSKKV